MQDVGTRYPPFEHRDKCLPSFASLVPQSIDTLTEGTELSDVARHCVVLVVAVDDLSEPCTDFAGASMHAATKLNLDGLEFRGHSRFRRNAPHGEGSCLVPLPTVVGEAQEVERRRFSRATLLPISDSIAPELDQPGLLRMEFQSEPRQPPLELFKEPHSVSFQLEAKHKIVGIANDDDLALSHSPAPDIYPQIEDVVQLHVGEQR